MGRVVFQQSEQAKWINDLLKSRKTDIHQLAILCGVSTRTVRDWRREKYTISEIALNRLIQSYNFPIPQNINLVSDYWYVTKGAKKGALKRLLLYGPPGTTEGRKRGGEISQQRRRDNPEKYRLLGCNVRKTYSELTPSESFAEMIGIILGDGGVTNYQLKISLGSQSDREYALFVKELIHKVFHVLPGWYEYKNDNVIVLCISGANLIEELAQWGIKTGNKITNEIDFPSWIWQSSKYQKACVRGLMDTDGGVYLHYHWVKGIRYRNLGLCFTSWSKPLLFDVSRALSRFNVKHSVRIGRIYMYDLKEIVKYFEIFGSSNPKHIQKLHYHLSNSKKLAKIGKLSGGVA